MNSPGRIFLVILSFAMINAISASAQDFTGDGLLQKGDTIKVFVSIEDFEQIKGKSVGSTVEIKVLDQIDRLGKPLIKKLEPVYCTINSYKKSGIYGSAAAMTITIDSTHSTGGTMIPFRGKAEFKGKGKKTIAFILFPIGWLFKGTDVQFPKGNNIFKPVVGEKTPLKYLK